MNRWWSFILMVTILVASSALPSLSRADGTDPTVTSDQPAQGGSSVGDPDMPINPGRKPSTGRVMPQKPVSQLRTAGDGGAFANIMMMRFRIALQALRGWLLHF